ncbi:hypothetical protein CYMTET_26053 [Cymbomonas tetramitiformis]|uniref:Uncharacterized protein n=1 Tax=Cymbomonas tetramitiformis TaxID=36881 RepID=A0AAE0FSV6_9CHLO|nr:hypothetical protein CYMTET_26053 [Cymbomonas tetramitiformis]
MLEKGAGAFCAAGAGVLYCVEGAATFGAPRAGIFKCGERLSATCSKHLEAQAQVQQHFVLPAQEFSNVVNVGKLSGAAAKAKLRGQSSVIKAMRRKLKRAEAGRTQANAILARAEKNAVYIKNAIATISDQKWKRDVLGLLCRAISMNRLTPDMVLYQFICDTTNNLTKKDSRGFRWSTQVKRLVKAMRAASSARAALDIARGNVGGEEGSYGVKEVLRYINLGFPSDSSMRHFEKRDGDDPEWREGLSIPMLIHALKGMDEGLAFNPDAQPHDPSSLSPSPKNVAIEAHLEDLDLINVPCVQYPTSFAVAPHTIGESATNNVACTATPVGGSATGVIAGTTVSTAPSPSYDEEPATAAASEATLVIGATGGERLLAQTGQSRKSIPFSWDERSMPKTLQAEFREFMMPIDNFFVGEVWDEAAVISHLQCIYEYLLSRSDVPEKAVKDAGERYAARFKKYLKSKKKSSNFSQNQLGELRRLQYNKCVVASLRDMLDAFMGACREAGLAEGRAAGSGVTDDGTRAAAADIGGETRLAVTGRARLCEGRRKAAKAYETDIQAKMGSVYPEDLDKVIWKLRRNHDWPAEVNINQALTAYRLQLAVHRDDITEADVSEELAQAMYDAERLSLQEGGVDFDRFSYVPSTDAEDNWYCTVEDEPHKLKCLVTSVLGSVDDQEPPLISKAHILEAVRQNPIELWQLAHILSSASDDQNVVTCEDLFYNETLRVELRKLGYHQDALALQVFGNAHLAWDAPGLSQSVRSTLLTELRQLLKVLLAGRMHSVKGLMSGDRVGGFPRDLLLVLQGNIDARTHLLSRYPFLRETLNERSFSTDDLETEFGMLVLRCGFKPRWSVASGALHAIDELTTMKRDPDVGFSIPSASGRHYSHHVGTGKKSTQWSTTDANSLASYLQKITYRSKRQSRDKRTIRSYHAVKQ